VGWICEASPQRIISASRPHRAKLNYDGSSTANGVPSRLQAVDTTETHLAKFANAKRFRVMVLESQRINMRLDYGRSTDSDAVYL